MRTLGLADPAFLGGMGGGVSVPLLLDQFSGAAAAYSLRQLRTGVTNVVRVRRSSDNTEQDFTATQVTDGTLATFCGAGDGFVRTWYDQSGNSKHAEQTTTTAQPQIVSNGNLITESLKPALSFNGTSHTIRIPTTPVNMNAFSVNLVCKLSSASGAQFAFACRDPNRIYVPVVISATLYCSYAQNTNAFDFGTSNLLSRYLWQINAGASSANAWRNGVASTAVASSANADLGNSIWIGSYSGIAGWWVGSIQEVIFYASDQASNRTGIAADMNDYFAIY